MNAALASAPWNNGYGGNMRSVGRKEIGPSVASVGSAERRDISETVSNPCCKPIQTCDRSEVKMLGIVYTG
eukprot:5025111-Amphidinium_carterae.1